MSAVTESTSSGPDSTVELAITGMTCASCANRIERKLNKLDGVTATVNYATEKAKVEYADEVTTDDLVAVVQAVGYDAQIPTLHAAGPDDASGGAPLDERDEQLRSGGQRLLISFALSVPVVMLAMVPGWQFEYWQWLSLTLAATWSLTEEMSCERSR